MRTLVRSLLALGITSAASAAFFACAKGDEGVAGVEKDAASYGSSDAGLAHDADADAGPACIESDAGCSTGISGACGNGILHCDGGAPVCEPVAPTEACYTGGATTRNNGICKDGVQTCSDSTATCVGEVLPMAAENCFNNLDDDCDGRINNGCPSTVTLGASRTLDGAGGSGGGPTSVMCPTGAFVTRVDSWFDNNDQKASGVSIFCATPSLIQGASSYSVTLAANAPAPYGTQHGTANPSNQRTDDCGISGLTAIAYSEGYADSWVEALGHHCASSVVTLAPDNSITFSFVNSGYSNGPFSEYSNPPAGTFFDRDCNVGETPANQVVVGFSIHDGAYLDNITPICAPLVVTYQVGTVDP